MSNQTLRVFKQKKDVKDKAMTARMDCPLNGRGCIGTRTKVVFVQKITFWKCIKLNQFFFFLIKAFIRFWVKIRHDPQVIVFILRTIKKG